MSFAHRPGMNGAIEFYKTLPEYVVAWTGKEHVRCADNYVECQSRCHRRGGRI